MLYSIELFKKDTVEYQQSDVAIARLSWLQAIKVGCAQCLALIPGFSRTGSTLGGGLLVGLNHQDALRFSFLLATPIIFAAGVLKVPELFISYTSHDLLVILIGCISSAVTAYISIRFLTGYFQTKTLTPFAIYCVVVGASAFLVLLGMH